MAGMSRRKARRFLTMPPSSPCLKAATSQEGFWRFFGAGMEAWCPSQGLVTLIARFPKCQGGPDVSGWKTSTSCSSFFFSPLG